MALESGAEVVLEARLQAPYGQYPVDSLEIMLGGEVVARQKNDDQASELRLRAVVTPKQSSWAAARAHGSELLPYQAWLGLPGIPPMAHTSPIYFVVDEAPISSCAEAGTLAAQVQQAIDWAQTEARYADRSQREEVVKLYEKALAVYASLE